MFTAIDALPVSEMNTTVNATEILNYTNLILLKEVEKLRLAGLDVNGRYHAPRPDWRWPSANANTRFNSSNGSARRPTDSTSSLPSSSTYSASKITVNGSTYIHGALNKPDSVFGTESAETEADLASSQSRMEELSQPNSKYQVLKRLLTHRQTATPPGSPIHSAKDDTNQFGLNAGVLRVAKIEPRAAALSSRLKFGSGKKAGDVHVHFDPSVGEQDSSQGTDQRLLRQSPRDSPGANANSSDEAAQNGYGDDDEWNDDNEQYGAKGDHVLRLQISASSVRNAPRLKYTTSASLKSGTPRHVSSQTAKRNRALLAGLLDEPDESTSVPRFPIFRSLTEDSEGDASGARSSASDRDGVPGPSNSLADFSTLNGAAAQDAESDTGLSSRTETPSTDRRISLDDATFRNQHKIAYVRALNMATQKRLNSWDYFGQRISTRSFSYFSLLQLDRTPMNITAPRKTRRSTRSTTQPAKQKSSARNAKRNARPGSRIFGRIDVDSYLPSAKPPPSSLVIT